MYMRKIVKRSIMTFAVMGVIFNFSLMNTFAAPMKSMVSMTSLTSGYEGSIHKTSGYHTFSTDWQESAVGDDGYAALTYGYNTFLINEDYAWAYHSQKEHSAEVGNARGAFGSEKKAAGKEAKIEVAHSGTSIQYQNTWYK